MSTKEPIGYLDDSIFCNPKPPAPFFFDSPIPGPDFRDHYTVNIDDQGNFHINLLGGDAHD